MILKNEQTKYVITDSHSQNDAILIGYLTAGLDNITKKLLHKQARNVAVVALEDLDEKSFYLLFDEAQSQDRINFNWSLCENLFLLRAYQHFTPKMKRIFSAYYLLDKPAAKIAKKEKCAIRAVYRTLDRCKEYIIFEKMQEEKQNENTDNC